MDRSFCQHCLKELFLVLNLKCYCVGGGVCPDWCLCMHMHMYMCVSEFVGRCGLCEFQANDGLQKSDNRVNTLSHNH